MVTIESNRIYISFVLLFTVLFVCTILTITPGTILKNVDAYDMDEEAEGYEKNQATSQANDCGNGRLHLNVGCENTASQIQGG